MIMRIQQPVSCRIRMIMKNIFDNFNRPERQWDILATPERTSAFLARHGM